MPMDAALPLLTYAAIIVDVVDIGDEQGVFLKVFPPHGDDHIVTDAWFSESPTMGAWTWPPRV